MITHDYITVDGFDYEVEMDVDYSIRGKFIPATYWEPADYPELDINFIEYKVVDLDGNEIKITTEIQKAIDDMVDYARLEELCWDDAKKQKDDYDDHYENYKD